MAPINIYEAHFRNLCCQLYLSQKQYVIWNREKFILNCTGYHWTMYSDMKQYSVIKIICTLYRRQTIMSTRLLFTALGIITGLRLQAKCHSQMPSQEGQFRAAYYIY